MRHFWSCEYLIAREAEAAQQLTGDSQCLSDFHPLFSQIVIEVWSPLLLLVNLCCECNADNLYSGAEAAILYVYEQNMNKEMSAPLQGFNITYIETSTHTTKERKA